MMRLLSTLVCAFMLLCAQARAQWTLVANVDRATAGTTAARDTTGADLIVVAVAYGSADDGTITDSESNTWSTLTVYNDSLVIWYVINPTTSASHTFTNTGGNVPSFYVGAFSAPAGTTVVVGEENGAGVSGNANPATEVTPESAAELLYVAACRHTATADTLSIDDGYTITDQEFLVGGTNVGGGMAYKAVSSEAPSLNENPTWDLTGSAVMQAVTHAVFEARSALDYVKQGVAVAKPASMSATNNGPYFVDVIDLSSIADFPYKWGMYFSSDHAVGPEVHGIWLFLANSLDGPWVDFDDAVTAGDFDTLAPTQTTNPIFAPRTQTETPHLNFIGSTLTMLYHPMDGTHNQSTFYATSTNGVDFTDQSEIWDYTPSEFPGNAHTGYPRWAANPFSGLANSYVGYGLHGGGGEGYNAQWGADAIGSWTRAALLKDVIGRASVGIDDTFEISWLGMDPKGARDLGGGYYSLLTNGTIPGVAQAVYEVVLDDTGTRIERKPVLVLPAGGTGDSDEVATQTPRRLTEGGTDYVFYVASDSSADKEVHYATRTTPGTDRVLADFPALDPALPSLDTTAYDLQTTDPLPSGLSTYSTGGTVNFTPEADGFEVQVVTASESGAVIADNPIDFSAHDYVEVWFTDFHRAGDDGAQIFFGLTTNNTAPESTASSDVIRCYNSLSGGKLQFEVITAGTQDVLTNIDSYQLGDDEDSATRDEVTSVRSLGLRIWPNDAYCELIAGTVKTPFHIGDVSGADLTDAYYPYFLISRGPAATSDLNIGGMEFSTEATGAVGIPILTHYYRQLQEQ